ncbi:MAG: hypothetical protein M1837_006510 [Sclerophora amabilis]|nr:MAG: hypothetical protein M1837_006510 [Sclerophora amabilis]
MNHSQQAQAPYEDEAALRKLSEQDDPDVNEAVRDKFQRRSTRKRKEPDRFAPSAPESDLVVAYGDDPAEVTTSTTASGLTNGGQRIPLRTPPKTPEKRALDPVDQSVNESGAGPAFSAKKPRIQESNQQELDHSGANHHDLRSAAKLPQPLQLVSDQIVDSGSVSGMTFRAADLACELHGEDLTEAAQRAQNAGLIKSDVDVNSLRFVHDEWMIPMKCQQ